MNLQTIELFSCHKFLLKQMPIKSKSLIYQVGIGMNGGNMGG
jgi:hypothetical protein